MSNEKSLPVISSALPVEEERSIPYQVSRLEGLLDTLSATCFELDNRLTSVCLPLEEPKQVKVKPSEDAVLAPLGHRLVVLSERVAAADYCLQSLLGRLAV